MLVSVLATVQIILVSWWAAHRGLSLPMAEVALHTVVTMAGALLVGSAARLTIARQRPDMRFVGDLSFALVTIVLVATAYTWSKLLIPGIHPRLFDAQLRSLDLLLTCGVDPGVFVRVLIGGAPWFARILGSVYGAFVWISLAGTAWYAAAPRVAARRRFVPAVASLWLIGSWGYLAVPALGPVFVDEAVWIEVHPLMPNLSDTAYWLALNYQATKQMLAGESETIVAWYGVAAMPSLHVGLTTLLALWAPSRVGNWLWWIIAALMFVGSVASGWHWLVDSIAGAVLAGAVYLIARPQRRIRWGEVDPGKG